MQKVCKCVFCRSPKTLGDCPILILARIHCADGSMCTKLKLKVRQGFYLVSDPGLRQDF